MPTTNSRLINLTDRHGDPMIPVEDMFEPNPGSICLTDGLHGTAWQRFFSDGRWHPTRGGGSLAWEDMVKRNGLVLVYEAEEREDQTPLIITAVEYNRSPFRYSALFASENHIHLDTGECVKKRLGPRCT